MGDSGQLSWPLIVRHLSNDKKQVVRTLDTVFVDSQSGVLQWYFTNKSGSVSRKKDNSTTTESVLDRFSRFSLSNPCNTEGVIGVLVDLPVGSRKLMKRNDLETFLSSGMDELRRSGAFLQVYLRPLRGFDVLFSCESNRMDEMKYDHEVIVVHQSHNTTTTAPSGKHEVTEDMHNQITAFSDAIIACLRDNHGLVVDQMTIECIVDDNQQAWLSSISQCETSSLSEVLNESEEEVGETISPSQHGGADADQRSHEGAHQHQQTTLQNQGSPNKQGTTGMTKAAMKKDIAERKKAKKELKTGDSGFKRNPVDMPPSIELMAKFAAEKERQERLLSEEEQFAGHEHGSGHKKKGKSKDKGLKRSHSGNAASAGAGNYLPSLNRNPDVTSMLDPVNHIDLAERHLEELQKRASAAAAVKSIVQQQQQAPLMNMSAGNLGLPGARQPLGSAASNSARPGTHMGSAPYPGTIPNTRQAMSGSEAEFLVRQIHSATDLSQLSMFSNMDEFESVAAGLDGGRNGAGLPGAGLVAGGESIWSTDGFVGDPATQLKNNSSLYGTRAGSMTDVVGDALKEKMAGLERQIAQLNAALARKEAELEKKDAKMKKLASDVDIAKRDAAMDIRRLTAEHELDLLRLKEMHSKDKAALIINGPPAPEANTQQGAQSPGKRSAAPAVSSHEANSKLIEQVEALRQENRSLQERAADERRALMIEHSNKLLSQERALRAEIMELRSMHAGYEDRLTQSGEELSAAMAKIHALQGSNQQLEIAKKSALEAQQRLRGDLKNMQQSVQASYRLETSQGIGAGGGGDADTAIRLADAKNEAKTRQLMNKLEFLKAQLDAEKKSADDARAAVQMMQNKLDELREEHRGRMLKAESDQRYAVEMVEQQLEAQYSERMKELTTLQVKFLSVQGQLGEAQEQEMLAKQREDNARGQAAKAASLQAALKTELEQLRTQVAKLREEKELEVLKESGKQSQDAVIRRLDNERQYLKSQLASEVTHKSELQAAFGQCQQQLSEVQKQWKSDVDMLKDQAALASQHFADKELKYLQLQTQLDSELKRSQAQSKDLKEGFVRLRDQVRMEQLALENANAQHRRLQEAFEEAQAEITRQRQQEQQTAAMHRAQMDAINETVAQQEQRNVAALQKLKDELSGQFMDNAHAQTVMMRMRDEFAMEKLVLTKISGVVKLAEVLRRWKRCRVFTGFRRWHTNSSLVGAAKQFREQVEGILKKTSKEMHKDKVQALDNLRNELNERHMNHLRTKEAEWEENLNDAMRAADEQKQRELANAAEEAQAQLQQAEADFMFDLQNARKECEEEIERTIARKDAEIAQLEKNFRVDAELARQDALRQQEDALIVKEQEMNEIMRQRLQLQEEDLSRKHDKLVQKLTVEHDFHMHQKEAAWKADMEKLRQKMKAEHDLAVLTLSEQHKQAMAEFEKLKESDMENLRIAMATASERALSQQRADMHTAEETRIRELRAAWQEEFEARSAQLRSEFDALLATKMEEYGKAVEAEKQRAVKLEASKWKQALKDSSQNHELQSMKTKAEVANEKDREMRLELQKMSDSFETKRREDLAAHQADLEGARRDHAVALERQANTNALAMEKMKAELEVSLKKLHDAFWTDKMNLEMGALEQTYKSRMAKEQARMDQLKQDFAQQTQNFALERSNLQRQVNHADERILQMEATNKADMAALKRAHDEAKKLWEENKADEMERLEGEYARKTLESNHETERRCNELAEKRLQEESSRMNEEMDRQVGQMQDESEKLISGLEQAMGNLKNEKGALTKELEGLSNKLEETEDCLYDLKQECKRIKMDSSLAVWKSVTKIFQMRQRFQEGIAQFDREATKRYEDIKHEMQVQLDHCMLAVLKLAALLQENDAARIMTHTILTGHRTGELVANRNKIQVMEQDLERLTMEKDSLEEQKELLESDIHQMEAQVRELEDQIRVHNQESSMSNGRINVAHARKKRRLDTDLEQLLESIEQKRHAMSQMDRRVTDKAHERDDVEMELIDIERKLVEILLEQQKLVLSRLEEGRLIVDKAKVVLGVAKVQYPVPAEPTMDHVLQQEERMKLMSREAQQREMDEEEDRVPHAPHRGQPPKELDKHRKQGAGKR